MNKDLFSIVEQNDINSLTSLANSGSIKDVKDEFGYSLLHRSITKGFNEISEILIRNGIDVNSQDKNGQTALHYAAFYGNTGILKVLLDNGADFNIADNYGNQPLWTATFNDKGFGRRLEIIDELMKNGADANHKNNVGKSPLDFSVTAKYEKVQELLRRTRI